MSFNNITVQKVTLHHKVGDLVKLWPSNKPEPIIGLVVDFVQSDYEIIYEIFSDEMYMRRNNLVSHVDYDIDKELDFSISSRRIVEHYIKNDIIKIE